MEVIDDEIYELINVVETTSDGNINFLEYIAFMNKRTEDSNVSEQ